MTQKAQLTPVGAILIYGLLRMLRVGAENTALFGRVTGKQLMGKDEEAVLFCYEFFD
jgi:hypothetical protein